MDYVIYGAGGHAQVLLDLIRQLPGNHRVVHFFQDDNAPDSYEGIPVSAYDPHKHPQARMLIGIGSSGVRQLLAEKVKHTRATLVHPGAYVAGDVVLGAGTVVLAGAAVQAGARIGAHCIINAQVTIDHDARVEDFVTTYPGVYIGAEAKIGAGSLIQPNAVVMRSVHVPAGMTVPPLTCLDQ